MRLCSGCAVVAAAAVVVVFGIVRPIGQPLGLTVFGVVLSWASAILERPAGPPPGMGAWMYDRYVNVHVVSHAVAVLNVYFCKSACERTGVLTCRPADRDCVRRLQATEQGAARSKQARQVGASNQAFAEHRLPCKSTVLGALHPCSGR